MPKNIVIFSDGTGQAGGINFDEARTNVYKLYRACRVGPDTKIEPSEQVAFYDPGLGSASDGGHFKIGWMRWLYNLASMATGLGITRNIVDCYAAIIGLLSDRCRLRRDDRLRRQQQPKRNSQCEGKEDPGADQATYEHGSPHSDALTQIATQLVHKANHRQQSSQAGTRQERVSRRPVLGIKDGQGNADPAVSDSSQPTDQIPIHSEKLSGSARLERWLLDGS
jgi:hypothetical protein